MRAREIIAASERDLVAVVPSRAHARSGGLLNQIDRGAQDRIGFGKHRVGVMHGAIAGVLQAAAP